MDSDDELDQLVAREVAAARFAPSAPSSDAELDALLHEALSGPPDAAFPLPAPRRRPSSASESDSSGASLLAAVLAGRGLPPLPNAVAAPPPTKTTGAEAALGDERCVLGAILRAVRGRQSSVSGDLSADADDVDAVLRRAEETAAAALRHGDGRAGAALHVHEHTDLRAELARGRGALGWPSCLCARPAGEPALGVGTSLGVVLLLDGRRRVCGVCGSAGASRGAVLALSLAAGAPLLLAGYETGALVLWHTASLAALREIRQEYTVAVARLRHCHPDPWRALVLDAAGAVRLLSFSRVMARTVYRLTGVAAAATPFSDVDVVFVRAEAIHLVAAVAADALVLAALACGAQSVATPMARRTRPPTAAQTHELVQFAAAQAERLLLCLAWGAEVEVYSVAVNGALCEMRRVSSLRLARPLHAMAPIAGACLALLDQNATLHLLDAAVGVVVETRRLHGVEPVVFASRSCGTRHTGALAHGRDEAIVLGRHRTVTCSLLSWRDRLDALVERRRYPEALELAKAFALEVALAAVGLSADPATRRASIAVYLKGLITAYLSDAVTASQKGKEEGNEDSVSRRGEEMEGKSQNTSPLGEVKQTIFSVIQFCAETDVMDIFFGPVMEYLRQKSMDTFALYCLERCILSGAVTSLPEMYIQPFFTLFTDEVQLAQWDQLTTDIPSMSENSETKISGILRVERALMHLDSGYDLLLRIAETHHLLRLAVAVRSYRQRKYVDALLLALKEERGGKAITNPGLTEIHVTSMGEGKSNASHDNNSVALSFFECTVKGYAILGDSELPGDQRRSAQQEVWKWLLSHTKDFLFLLCINPARALAAAMQSLHDTGPYSPWGDESESELSRVRCVVLLFHLLVGVKISATMETFRPWELARRPWPPYDVVHQLFSGSVDLVLCGMPIPGETQVFCEYVCTHMIYQFQSADDEIQRQSTQRSLTALFSSTITEKLNFSFIEDDLRQQHMARALAALHCSRLQYIEAIDCYLDKQNNATEPGLVKDVFRMIKDEMNRALLLPLKENSQLLRNAVMHRISLLVDVDATSLAQFVFEYLPGNHEDVMNILRNSSGTFLLYLDELVAKGDPAVASDVKLQNTYIELLCSHEPVRVYPYLHSNDSIITYDLHLALQAVKRYKVADAAVFLLEKTLMIDEAMDILMNAVLDKLSLLRQEVVTYVSANTERQVSTPSATRRREEGGGVVQSNDHTWLGEALLQQVLEVGIDLCTKYNSQDSESQSKWFRLLELFTRPRRLLCDRQGQHMAFLQSGINTVNGFEDDELKASLSTNASSKIFPLLSNPLSSSGVVFLDQMITLYTKYVSHLLTHMIKVLDLAQVVGKIVKDHEREKFGPFKPIIVDIMSSLSFELKVNKICKLSIDSDIMTLGQTLHRSFNNGIVPLSDTCYICAGGLGDVKSNETETSVRIYACGHGYHESCAVEYAEADCIQCQKEQMGDTPHTSRRKNGSLDEDTEKESRRARHTKRNGTEEEEEEEENNEDVPLILRRLKHTRAKVDGARNYRHILRSFLASTNSETTNRDKLLNDATGKKLLLAPAPPVPVTLGDFAEDPLDFKETLTITLTDEDVLELFGSIDDDVRTDPPFLDRRFDLDSALGSVTDDSRGAGS